MCSLRFQKKEALSLETNKKEIQERIYWMEIPIKIPSLKGESGIFEKTLRSS
jgi:hypothetical protein